jgi:YNFM family putative membrane transporter
MNTTEPELIKEHTSRFWSATISLSIGAFLVFSNFHFVQPLLPLLSQEFDVSPSVTSLTISLVTFSLSIFLLVFGPLSDAIGRKNLMASGLLFSSLISVAIFFVSNFETLLILRTLQGIALASLPAIAYAYIAEEFDPRAIGITIGLYISGNTIGGMGGRIISGFSADLWGWRSSFLIIGIIGLICFFLFMLLLPQSNHFKPRPFSFKKANQEIWMHLKNPVLRPAYYIAGIIFFIFMGLFNYLSYHLHADPYRLSSTFIGLLFLSYLAGTFSSTFSGKLEGVLTIPQRIFIGLIIMLAGILLMLAIPLYLILIGLIIVCFGFFFTHAAAMNWVSSHTEEAKASASSLYLFFYYIGGSIGSTLLGYTWELWGWKAVVGVNILLLFIGMGCAWMIYKIGSESPDEHYFPL